MQTNLGRRERWEMRCRMLSIITSVLAASVPHMWLWHHPTDDNLHLTIKHHCTAQRNNKVWITFGMGVMVFSPKIAICLSLFLEDSRIQSCWPRLSSCLLWVQSTVSASAQYAWQMIPGQEKVKPWILNTYKCYHLVTPDTTASQSQSFSLVLASNHNDGASLFWINWAVKYFDTARWDLRIAIWCWNLELDVPPK